MFYEIQIYQGLLNLNLEKKLKLSLVKLSLENWVKQPPLHVPGNI